MISDHFIKPLNNKSIHPVNFMDYPPFYLVFPQETYLVLHTYKYFEYYRTLFEKIEKPMNVINSHRSQPALGVTPKSWQTLFVYFSFIFCMFFYIFWWKIMLKCQKDGFDQRTACKANTSINTPHMKNLTSSNFPYQFRMLHNLNLTKCKLFGYFCLFPRSLKLKFWHILVNLR